MSIVKCPTCGNNVVWSDKQRWRPFCSERCRLIDLGEWANESHRIPGKPYITSAPDSDSEKYS